MLNILNRINHGYEAFEPVVLGLMAMNKSFMLIGRHGTGKTRLARTLSQGYGEEGFVFYDATKDDLIAIAGIPDAEGIKEGEMDFVPHQRTIWNKNTVVVDEITRANKENQNLWLEIVESRTCFGLPLSYRTLIATANPESYAAAFQLDEALLDRFYAVVPVPEMQEQLGADDVSAMARLALGYASPPEAEEIARVFAEIQKAYRNLVEEGATEKVVNYLSKLVPALMRALREQDGPYVSARTYSRNLPETILAVAAYYEVAGKEEPLREAAATALRYAVATKLQIKPVTVQQVHESCKHLLSAGQMPEKHNIRLELDALDSFEERLDFVEKRWDDIQKTLGPDEIEKTLGELLSGATQKGEKEKLVALQHMLNKVGYKGDALRQVDGRLLITLNSAIDSVMPRLNAIRKQARQKGFSNAAIKNIDSFQRMVEEGKFVPARTPEVLKLKKYLIDRYEGDQPQTDEALVECFDSLDLGGQEGQEKTEE